MKIGFFGIELPEGKVRYQDGNLLELQNKDSPKKVTPYFAEFLRDELVHCDAIIVPADDILALLIQDMEKVETRMSRLTDAGEKQLMSRALQSLEDEIPLCDVDWTEEERTVIVTADPYSLKPVVKVTGDETVDAIISLVLDRAGYTFFYTSGPKESHAWLVKKGSDMLTCAEKIHSDLARGFIKAEVVALSDYLACHSFNECRSKGLVRVTDRDYLLEGNQVLEFKFNV